MPSKAEANRWARVRELLASAVRLEPAERPAFLQRECGGDGELLREVVSLLAAHEATGPLDRLGAALGEAAVAAPPTRIGRYRTVDRIGGGGMGLVFRAYDERLERSVALKFLSPMLGADPDWRDRFLAEARAAASLDHPNICTIHEVGETGDEGHLFIAMPLYGGRTLKASLEEGPLPAPLAIGFGRQVCEGLAKAHDHGIVHRDVKPANLIVTEDGIVKILDFGVAMLERSRGVRAEAPGGTAAYLSPEQARGAALDHRTDLWSLGVVLYELLTGVRPFDGDSWPELRQAILAAAPRPPSALRPALPSGVDEVLAHALTRDPEDRFPSAEAMAAALGRVGVGGAGGSAPVAVDGGGFGAAVSPEGERRQATVLVTLARSDAGASRPTGAGPGEPWLTEVAVPVVTRHGGTIARCDDRELIAVFGLPTAREDDCVRAARAAGEVHRQARRYLDRDDASHLAAPSLASGLQVGSVVARPSPGSATLRASGPALQAASRLARRAQPGAVLAAPSARRLLAPFFRTEPADPIALPPDGQRVTTWAVLGETGFETRLEATARSGLTPFVGRQHELELLRARLALARTGTGQFVSVRGSAGAGKSRLLLEFERGVDRDPVRVLRGRCRSWGATIAYRPFREALQDLLGLDLEEPPSAQREQAISALRRIAPDAGGVIQPCLHVLALAADGGSAPAQGSGAPLRESVMDALGAVFALSSRRRPVALLLEDWHWADEASSGLLQRLLELVPAHPMLVVVTHRPDPEPDWHPAVSHTPVRLGPLDPSAAHEIVRSVLSVETVPPEVAEALHERAGGNPFFLEELCRSLKDEGAVEAGSGRAEAGVPLNETGLPETVQGVIRTRLDRIDADARDAIRIASVIGLEFEGEVLAGVLPDDRRFVRCVDRLTGMGFVHPVSLLPRRLYRFSHVLTQEVAYASLLARQRRSLHGRVARTIESVNRDRREDFLEELAHHFGKAHEWSRAAEYALRAAERAVELSELHQALALLESAQRWLEELSSTDAVQERRVAVLLRQKELCGMLGLDARLERIETALAGSAIPGGAGPPGTGSACGP